MKTFQDDQGETWELRLTIGAAERVRDTLQVNLLEPLEPLATSSPGSRKKPPGSRKKPAGKSKQPSPALVAELDLDMPLLCAVIHVLLKPQIDAAKLTDADFADRLDGPTLRLAHDAFFDEWRDFFQQVGRPETADLIQKQIQYLQRTLEAAHQKLMEPEVDETVHRKIDREVGKSFGSLPGLLESIPAP